MKHRRLVVAMLILVFVAASFRAAAAITLGCGDTIGPASGTFTLDADVGVCNDVSKGPSITILGPARLDMNGHTLVCGADPEVVGNVAESNVIGFSASGLECLVYGPAASSESSNGAA